MKDSSAISGNDRKKERGAKLRHRQYQSLDLADFLQAIAESEVTGVQNRKYDLEERLISFAVRIIGFSEKMSNTAAGKYYASQILRSGCAPPLQYGEAQGAESRSDFVHKIRVLLKEHHETYVNLKIIKRVPLSTKTEELDYLLRECNELIAIFNKRAVTASQNKFRN